MRHTKLIARAVLAAVYVILVCLMFITGRTHTVLVDNKGAEDGSYSAVKEMEISVNGGKPVEFFKNDRDKFTVKGQRLHITVGFFGMEEDQSFNLKIPLTEDAVIVSVPKLLADIEPALEVFSLTE